MWQTAVGDSLAEVWLDAPVRLLSTMILDEEALEAFCGQAALNTDDLPLAGSDWFIPAQAALDNVTRLFAAQSPVYPYVSKVGNEEARGQLAESFERHFAAIRYLPDADYIARRSRNPAQAAEWAESAVAACPENPRIRYERARTWISLLKRSPNATMDREVRLCALTALQGALPREDTAAARRGPPERFIAPLRLNLAIMYLLEEQPSAAQREAELVLRLDPNEPTAREVAAQASLQLMQMSNRLLGPEGSDDSKR